MVKGFVAMALVFAACGGSSSGTPSPSATGTPIKVMVTSPFSGANSVTNYPEIIPAVNARAAAVNTAGGINGHPIQVESCDDQTNANLAASCARQAVSDGVVAVIGGFSLNVAQQLPILEQAGIPIIGQTVGTIPEAQPKIAFPFASGDINWLGAGKALGQAGCKKLGVIALSGLAISRRLAGLASDSFMATGGTVVDTVLVPNSSPDYSPVVASLIGKGAECIAPVMGAGETLKVVTAVKQSGKNLRIAQPVSGITSTLQALGSQADGIIGIYPAHLVTDDVPAIKTAVAEIKKYGGSDVKLSAGTAIWGPAKVLFEAMKSIKGDITAASVLDALSKVSRGVSDFYAPIDFTHPGPDPTQPRAVNYSYLTWTVTNGAFKLTSPSFISAK